MALSAAQLTLLRNRHPHFASMYLSIFAADTDTVTAAGAPGVVYAGTVNGAHNRGARNITCANIGVGVIGNVVPGQTVLVGTALGDDSISKRRLRHRADQVLTLDANGVVWTAGDFITVIENYEFWPVYPKILDVSPYTMYKDDNITYSLATYTDFDATTANLQPEPVAIMGPPWAGWLVSGTVTVTLDGSNSYTTAPGATIPGGGYAWWASGGAIANAAIATTTITFTTCGVYWVRLTITDSNGKVQRTRRPFFVHDPDDCPPFYDFNADTHLTHDQGNDLRISALRDVTLAEIPDQALVVLWSDEYFRGAANPPSWTQESIGGFTGREHIKFVGYLDRESIESDPEDAGALTFEAYSINKIMADTMMWGIALNDTLAVPTVWYQYQNINTARAVHHLWRWHSTLFLIADVRLPLDANLPVPGPPDNDTLTRHGLRRFAIDFAEGDLISQARIAAWDQGIHANIGCDKQGVVHVEVDPLMIAEGVANTDERGVVDQMQTVTDEDWYEEIEIIRNERFRTAWATISGLNWDGATKTPYIAVMPGEDPTGAAAWDSTPEVAGMVLEEGNKLFTDQADANERAGLVWARGSNDLAEIRVPEFAGNYSHVDVYPQAFYEVSIPPNKRGLSTATTRRGIPRQVTINFDGNTGITNVSTVLEPETIDVLDGVPGKYPTSLPDPAPENPPKFPEPEDEARVLYGAHYGAGIYWSPDAGTTWVQRIGARAGAQLNSRWAYTDPWGPNRLKQGSYNPEVAILQDGGLGYIYRSTNAGRNWVNITPTTAPPDDWGDAPTAVSVTYEMGVANWHQNKQHWWIAWYQTGGGLYRGYLVSTANDGLSQTWYNGGFYDDALRDLALFYTSLTVPYNTLEKGDSVTLYGGATSGDAYGWDISAPASQVGIKFTPAENIAAGTNDGFEAFVDAAAVIFCGTSIIGELGCGDNAWNVAVPNVWEYLGPRNWVGCGPFAVGVQEEWRITIAGLAPTVRRIRQISLWADQYGEALGCGVADEIRPICIDIGKQTGTTLYITCWEESSSVGALTLRVYDITTGTPVLTRRRVLAPCTRAEFDNRTYFAGCKTLYDSTVTYEDCVICFGRWNDGTVRHLVRSNDAGVTLTDIGDSATWTTRWVGAAVWESWNRIILCVNGTSDYLVGTSNGGAAWNAPVPSATPFEVEFAMTMHAGTKTDPGTNAHYHTIAIGQRNGAGTQKQDAPYTGAWTPINPGGAGTRIGALHWCYNEVP